MLSRESQIVGGVAVFIIVVGIVSAVAIMAAQQPIPLDENMWFRVTSASHDNSTLAAIYISDDNGIFKETFLYTEEEFWQGSTLKYAVGIVLEFVIFFFDTSEHYDATYRVGKGPVSVDIGPYTIDFISYWEEPDY